MSKILVLQGAPASGKSTYARELALSDKKYVIVNRDTIRQARGEYWIPEQESYISEIEEFEVRSAIKNNLIPIIDATNLNPKTVEKWKALATELNSEIEFKMFYIDMKTAIERDKERELKVGKKTIESFFLRYFPDMYKDYYTDDRLKNARVIYDSSKINCLICDLDGTLCLHNGRNAYNLAEVSTDIINTPLMRVLIQLNFNTHIIFLSGREGTKQCRKDTEEWLKKNFYDNTIAGPLSGWHLLMRNEKDFRPDEVIKKEIFYKDIEPKYNTICVFDDRDKVVKMWRDLGFLCNQVYYGDF